MKAKDVWLVAHFIRNVLGDEKAIQYFSQMTAEHLARLLGREVWGIEELPSEWRAYKEDL